MSPEQAQNAKDVDARTDLWSLAASLYQVVTGVRPWEGLDSLGEVIVAICTKDLPPVQEVAPWVDPELADIIQKGLQRDRKARWRSATEMKAALAAYADGVTVSRVSLEGISPQTKERVAPRISLVMAETASLPFSTDPSSAATIAPRSKTPLFTGVAGVALLVAVGAVMVNRQGSTPMSVAASVAPLPAPSASATAAARVQARVIVAPRDARVSVGDRPTNLGPGGVLLLEGEAGEEFEVAVEAGEQLVKKSVKLVAQGKAEPSSIEVTPTPAASGKHPATPVPVGKPGPVKTNAAGGTTPPPPPATPPADKPPAPGLPPRF
jgi:serine/threonine-protein kinase